MTTPHIAAPVGAIAPAVLLPGDPLRARWMATELLSDAVEVTSVRGILGYTGTWGGAAVSVMGTGMGVPSVSIYATELARFYGVARLVRVGSCGAISNLVGLRDLVVVSGASTDSGVNRRLVAGHDFAATPDFALTRALADAAFAADTPAVVGRVFTSDTFYGQSADELDLLRASGHLAVEMEAAGLFGVAAVEGVAAAAVLTVSDHLDDDTHLSPAERQEGFSAMAQVALAAVTS
ncbi:MAG: purine-nucleoside phosphorylase [Microthrixaceae bacterium]